MWPYNEDDHMEIGDSAWVPCAEGWWMNKHTGHTINEAGEEFDAEGKLIAKIDKYDLE